MSSENGVAKLLKGLGRIIGVVGVISAFVVGAILSDISYYSPLYLLSELAFPIGAITFVSCGVTALLLFAFGEVISLLQDIKGNTDNRQNGVGVSHKIPKL